MAEEMNPENENKTPEALNEVRRIEQITRAVRNSYPIEVQGQVQVGLTKTSVQATPDLILWQLIATSSQNLSFDNYQAFIDFVLCGKKLPDRLAPTTPEGKKIIGSETDNTKTNRYLDLKKKRFLPFTDTDAYRLLKVATEAFLAVNCAVKTEIDDYSKDNFNIGKLLQKVDATGDATLITQYVDDYLQQVNGGPKTLPYLALILDKLPDLKTKIKKQIFKDYETLSEVKSGEGALEECYGILQEKLTCPCMLELIWSYWHEQGMLVQTMNTISRRFQNIRGPVDQDPLAVLEFDPLRPLNNLLWGYIQDEQHRLSVVRRAYEYDHHYGLLLEGKAVSNLRPADSRSHFLESFHNLLYLTSIFYKQDDDTTVDADAFPVLNGLKDVHMLLTEGAHNQFGDLPVTARIEMLMQQWLLARPEFREVLPTRIMVAYPEPWMDRVDAMKKLQGWVDTSILHFRNLARDGEQILLSVRFGNWSDVIDANRARIWARFWRSEIQEYIHAYRTVTGVDLTASNVWQQQRSLVTTQPSTLLRRRLLTGRKVPALPAGATAAALPSFRERKAARKLTSG
jgi:hypothetical protein